MKGEHPGSSSSTFGFNVFNLANVNISPNRKECPICGKEIETKRTHCLGCGLKLSISKDVDKDKITCYFDQIKGMMESSRQEIEKNDIKTELRSIDRKISKNPLDDELWFQKGMLLYSFKLDNKALKALNAALDINENHNKALIAKAYILTKLKRYREASNCYRKALEMVLKISIKEGKRELESGSKNPIESQWTNIQDQLPKPRLKKVIADLWERSDIEGAILIEGKDTVIVNDVPEEKTLQKDIPHIMAEFDKLDGAAKGYSINSPIPIENLYHKGCEIHAKKCKNDLTLLVLLRDEINNKNEMLDIEVSSKKFARMFKRAVKSPSFKG